MEARFHPESVTLSSALAGLGSPDMEGEAAPPVTLGDVVDRTAHAGFGFLLALLTVVAIPLVGLATPFGVAVALLGAQMVAGKPRPWLPDFLRRRRVPPAVLRWLADRGARLAARLERMVKPRLTALARSRLVGVGIVIQGVGLALPLLVPGSNWIFMGPILVYGLALLADDGAWILVAHLCHLAQAVLAVLFFAVLRAGVERAVAWFG
jgi:hypothetical protein